MEQVKDKIKRFEDMEIWQFAREFLKDVYKIARRNAMSKDFGFRDQFQRSSLSIMSNIAEGFERKSSKEFSHFLYIAKGSCGELRSQLYAALDLNYISGEEFKTLDQKAERISKSLAGFIKYLKSSDLKFCNQIK